MTESLNFLWAMKEGSREGDGPGVLSGQGLGELGGGLE